MQSANNCNQGFDILVSDVDTVWMRDPLPFVLRYPDADILTSSDHLANTVTVRCNFGKHFSDAVIG